MPVSYRYKRRWGYIMIGAHNHADAMVQAARPGARAMVPNGAATGTIRQIAWLRFKPMRLRIGE